MFGHNYTKEQHDWIKKNRKKYFIKEFTSLFNERFGLSIGCKALSAYCKRHGIITGRTGNFEKGHSTWNKGKKGIHLSPKTEFRKGNIPANTLPIGSERLDKNGNILVKIGFPDKWKSKHELIWEEKNGPVPKGKCVVFINHNRDFDNIACVSKSELMRLNIEQYRKQPENMRKVILNLIKLEDKLKKK